MRIIITADLHHGITPWTAIGQEIEHISRSEPDVVVIAGDIGESRISLTFFHDVIGSFVRNCEAPVLVIPGNHDLWVNDGSPLDSKALWDHYLQELTVKAGGFWLEGANFILNRVAIVGSMLHYDLSCQDKVGPTATLPVEWFIINKRLHNNDAYFLKGLPEDMEFARIIGEGFRKRLQQAQDNPDIDHIVVVTHVPCLEEMITRKPQDFNWSVGTPYFGNLSHEDFIKGCSKVRYVVSGHSHQEVSAEIETPTGVIKAMVVGSQYSLPIDVCLDLP